ncbi:MAG: DUF445 domain-containing protein [Acidithiobacillus sp.]|uniref:DUF445 domain-containing protein n=1 Tax=Acidithiobacillus sp. TaxID=1872118 RepID=UPI003D0088C7
MILPGLGASPGKGASDLRKGGGMAAGGKPKTLRRMQGRALALLALAVLLFGVALWHGQEGPWAWVGAFAEAAIVGALADWFAVVALFRHPLGLPIPHTAIIPRNKARIADKLAAFVRDQFLETEAIVGLVRRLDPARTVAAWLQKKENAELLGRHLLVVVQEALHFVDDIRVRDALRETLRRQLGQIDVAQMAGEILDALTREHRHQELLEDGIQRLSRWLDQGETQQAIAETLREVLKRAYPTLFAWMGAVVDPAVLCHNLAENLVSASNKLLQEIAADPEHPRRQAFTAWVDDFIQRLKYDPRFRERAERWKGEILDHPALRDYVNGLWTDLQGWLAADLEHPDSRIHQRLVAGAGGLGAFLAEHEPLRAAINEHLEQGVRRLAEPLREGVARHIADTIHAWRDEDLVRQMEWSVGTDLQYIRINGTLVGGLIGLGIHAAVLAAALLH